MNHSKTGVLIFILIVVITSLTADLNHTLFYRPQSIHMWRQCDGASYALNYYQFGNSFFEPATHSQTGKNGRTVSEFPLFYYLAAKLYALFGFHEFFIRLIHFMVFLTGLWAFYQICLYFINDLLIAIVPVVFLLCSPYIFYYAPNFLPNVPALALMLLGLFFFFLYKEKDDLFWFYCFTITSLLGIILKVSEGVIFVALIALLFLNSLKINIGIQINNRHFFKLLAGVLLVTILSISWYLYVIYYNKINGTTQNLTSILPIWNMDQKAISDTFKRMISNGDWAWKSSFHHDIILIAIGLMQILFIVKWKKLNHFLRLYSLMLLAGVIGYSCLWFEAFFHHDYYMITLISYPLFLLLTVFEYLYRISDGKKVRKILLYFFSIIFILLSIWHNQFVNRHRYTNINDKTLHVYFDLEPYLRSIGIKNTDLTITVPDKSPNITLYLMNQPGWSECFNHQKYNIDYFVTLGAKYLIIGDESYLKMLLYSKYAINKIGQYKNISVYKIPDSQ